MNTVRLKNRIMRASNLNELRLVLHAISSEIPWGEVVALLRGIDTINLSSCVPDDTPKNAIAYDDYGVLRVVALGNFVIMPLLSMHKELTKAIIENLVYGEWEEWKFYCDIIKSVKKSLVFGPELTADKLKFVEDVTYDCVEHLSSMVVWLDTQYPRERDPALRRITCKTAAELWKNGDTREEIISQVHTGMEHVHSRVPDHAVECVNTWMDDTNTEGGRG